MESVTVPHMGSFSGLCRSQGQSSYMQVPSSVRIVILSVQPPARHRTLHQVSLSQPFHIRRSLPSMYKVLENSRRGAYDWRSDSYSARISLARCRVSSIGGYRARCIRSQLWNALFSTERPGIFVPKPNETEVGQTRRIIYNEEAYLTEMS